MVKKGMTSETGDRGAACATSEHRRLGGPSNVTACCWLRDAAYTTRSSRGRGPEGSRASAGGSDGPGFAATVHP